MLLLFFSFICTAISAAAILFGAFNHGALLSVTLLSLFALLYMWIVMGVGGINNEVKHSYYQSPKLALCICQNSYTLWAFWSF